MNMSTLITPPLRRDMKPWAKTNHKAPVRVFAELQHTSRPGKDLRAIWSSKAQTMAKWQCERYTCHVKMTAERFKELRSNQVSLCFSSAVPRLVARSPHQTARERQGCQSDRSNRRINNRIFITWISKDWLQILKMGVEKNTTKIITVLELALCLWLQGVWDPKQQQEELPYSPNLQELHLFHLLSGFPSLIPPFS